MQEHQLPTWNGIVDNALGELDASRNGLAEAASWLRSDWRPLGSPLPDSAGDARIRAMELIGQAKGLIDEAKGELYDARRGTAAASSPASAGAGAEQQIRTAYARLASRPQEWVTLTALRAELPHIPREALDAELVRLALTPTVHLAPEANQRTLTDADRAAAVRSGGTAHSEIRWSALR
ncbi:hypothetical protein [Actinomadura sp. 6N118]|uniref:hypothetical protein n=1 Tax=Actinomadura sp. 6N118 TaxID=3375151 RepID=UPI0037979589